MALVLNAFARKLGTGAANEFGNLPVADGDSLVRLEIDRTVANGLIASPTTNPNADRQPGTAGTRMVGISSSAAISAACIDPAPPKAISESRGVEAAADRDSPRGRPLPR
jgi:hypothetical protein